MLRFSILFIGYIVLIITMMYSDGHTSEEKSKDNFIPSSELTTESNEDIITNIENLENLSKVALKSRRGGFVPIQDTEILYEAMVRILKNLIESIKDVNKAYTFLNAEGIDRIIAYNFLIPHDAVRTNLLILMKGLFEVTSTTASIIPENIVDGLLDIFENESNLALKAHALDVLYLWLPNNPEIQARVMKLKGLEPFYYQVSKLDISVVQTLLDLFNKILKEHLIVRNEKIQRTTGDLNKLRLYQRIGLLERMSTPTVCNGLLDIFRVAWNFGKSNVLLTVLEIIGDIKPFCINIYGGNVKAKEIFAALLKFVQNENNGEYLLKQGMNVTNLCTILQEFLNNINIPAKRDEF